MLTHGLIPYAFETLATFWPNSRGQPSPSFVDGDRVHVQGSMCLKVWHLLNIFLAFQSLLHIFWVESPSSRYAKCPSFVDL